MWTGRGSAAVADDHLRRNARGGRRRGRGPAATLGHRGPPKAAADAGPALTPAALRALLPLLAASSAAGCKHGGGGVRPGRGARSYRRCNPGQVWRSLTHALCVRRGHGGPVRRRRKEREANPDPHARAPRLAQGPAGLTAPRFFHSPFHITSTASKEEEQNTARGKNVD